MDPNGSLSREDGRGALSFQFLHITEGINDHRRQSCEAMIEAHRRSVALHLERLENLIGNIRHLQDRIKAEAELVIEQIYRHSQIAEQALKHADEIELAMRRAEDGSPERLDSSPGEGADQVATAGPAADSGRNGLAALGTDLG